MRIRRRGRSLDVFEGLRRRLTALFATVAIVGLAALSALLIHLDGRYDAQRVDAILRGEASRAAALVYEQDGEPTAEALVGDHVATSASGLLVVHRVGSEYETLFASGTGVRGDWTPLARACMEDAAESGTFADVGDLRVAGMPWWLSSEDPAPLGCALAVTPHRPALQGDVALPAIAGSAAILLVLTSLVWWVAGQSLRVASRALADREQFLATAAHEMRGPLARMRAVAETALADLAPGQPGTASALRTLVATADGAGRVASNLLLASRIDHAEVPVHRLPVRLDELACEVETMIDGVVVDVREPVEVTGDAALLRQAMTNLVDNALRHGRSEDGHVEVLLSVFRDEGEVVVRVVDDGAGLPADLDVLRPYVAGRTGGTGLGLPLVRWIAERHGAVLRIGAAEGCEGVHGALVEMRFPESGRSR